ncbi:2-amino-4-hydroxy-6-hydroxymethyldihydropteridine diphosphokinase [Sanguibacter sp. A247]|uniref:2-amino-4-hydroxy-6- hydroxymethyldihydropteridine diphosphokinase n=1 Tax=unclassified Sanguibacter TaxID=2645534 RepID=UPI003FD86BF7
MTQLPGPVLDAHGRQLDQVRLTGLAATGFHGVLDHERAEGQTFVADVTVHVDTRRAAAADDLAHTLNYAELAAEVVEILEGPAVRLVETLAEQIAAAALDHTIVAAVDVAVHKPSAPVGVAFEDVVIAIRRDRIKLPSARFDPAAAPASSVATIPAAGAAVAGAAAPGAPGVAAPPVPVPPIPAPPGLEDPAHIVDEGPAHVVDEGAFGAAEVSRHDPSDDGPATGLLEPVHVPVPDLMDRAPAGEARVVVALGSNMGDPREILERAIHDLAGAPGIVVERIAPLARTAAVGGVEQPDFLNTVLLVRTTLSPRALLRVAHAVEQEHQRTRDVRWGPRTLDVDLISYEGVVGVTDDLELPHPRAHERAFVLAPWAQIAPDAVLPGLGGGPVAALAATAPDRDGVRWLRLDWTTDDGGARQ